MLGADTKRLLEGPWIFGNWITSSSWHSWGVSPRRPDELLPRQAQQALVRNLSTNWGNRYRATRDNHLS